MEVILGRQVVDQIVCPSSDAWPLRLVCHVLHSQRKYLVVRAEICTTSDMGIEKPLGAAYLVVGHTVRGTTQGVVVNINHADSSLSVRLSLDDASRLAERLQELVEQLRSEQG
jgi:hypothetical protein